MWPVSFPNLTNDKKICLEECEDGYSWDGKFCSSTSGKSYIPKSIDKPPPKCDGVFSFGQCRENYQFFSPIKALTPQNCPSEFPNLKDSKCYKNCDPHFVLDNSNNNMLCNNFYIPPTKQPICDPTTQSTFLNNICYLPCPPKSTEKDFSTCVRDTFERSTKKP